MADPVDEFEFRGEVAYIHTIYKLHSWLRERELANINITLTSLVYAPETFLHSGQHVRVIRLVRTVLFEMHTLHFFFLVFEARSLVAQRQREISSQILHARQQLVHL